MLVLDKIRSVSLLLPLEENMLSWTDNPIHWQNNCQDLHPQKSRVDKKCVYCQVCLGCHNFELHAGKDGCVMQNGEPELGAESNVKLCRQVPLAVSDTMFCDNFLSSMHDWHI
jgi:hypothetical protein